MLNGIDVSNWQGREGFRVPAIAGSVDFVIVKATGGTSFVDRYCDVFVQECKSLGKLWGFYHFAHDAGTASPEAEADFFVNNCLNYFGDGIPVLDWERDTCSVDWVNRFVRRVHDRTGVWCWIYANPWRFNQGGVEANCARWIAAYPKSGVMYLSSDPGNVPTTDGNVVCWQYSSNGRVNGWSGALDIDHYYGDAASWERYARGDRGQLSTDNAPNGDNPVSVLENDEYKVTVAKKS